MKLYVERDRVLNLSRSEPRISRRAYMPRLPYMISQAILICALSAVNRVRLTPELEFCWALNVTRVVAPPWLAVGGSGDLECQFSLGSETLYSIKWYQGINEIYRYTPGKVRTQQVFHNDFLSVDVSRRTGPLHVINYPEFYVMNCQHFIDI
ncbi:hypothetical protein HAZT_HAZT008468 [Hyalella azteca]|uniref:Ig-like domain-containing protein n=1 Tax=Hyalella azteca TaxID=294128 RepID=A0A6A0GYI4_HYAAZ|nr:hypothetical protein HAZT_HAZT008468 [Hyalella azteca]